LGTLLLLANKSSAQYLIGGSKTDSTLPRIEFGVKLGVDLESISGSNTWEQSYKPGIAGGIFVGMHKHKIGVRLEILASTARYTSDSLVDSAGNKGDFRAVYINIPLLFEYRIIPNLLLLVGPQYSNLISIASVDGFSGDVKAFFRQSEFSGVIGLEGKLPKHLSVGARYIYGFTNLNNEAVSFSTDKWRNSTIQLYAIYSIR